MSKSIEDYRNIVKVLKLQLLKVREQNNTLSKSLGIASQTQTSSFSTRLQKFKNSPKPFSKHMLLFTFFAHRCEIIGVTPEMVFRIADKKRDKKVTVTSLEEIMKRLKLKLDNVQISRLLSAITKSSHILYEEYLQYMSAFQINSEKYPFKSKRSYAQICMLKFGAEAKDKYRRPEDLYRAANNDDAGPYLSFENFVEHCKKYQILKQVEVISIFVALDLQSECQIERETFVREMGKIYNLIDKGVSYLDDTDERGMQGPINEEKSVSDDGDIKLEQETGVEAGNKNIKKPKPAQPKVIKGDSSKIAGEMKKQGIRVNSLIMKLLEKQEKRKLVKPFSLLDFSKAVQALNSKCQKKKIMGFFKAMDTSNNGSLSTDELIKLWLEGRQISDPAQILYKLLARHLRQIQCNQLISRFTTLGFEPSQLISLAILEQAFQNLGLDQNYLKNIQSYIQQKSTIQDFTKVLQTGGVSKSRKQFKQMKRNQFEALNAAIKKLLPKQSKNFPKYSRMDEDQESDKKAWDTIFTNQWSCWDFCVQTASKLKDFWRDHEFGPTKGDPHGYRSIVANESQVPPGLPFQQEISWVTFEQMLSIQRNSKAQVKLFNSNLSANDIQQGKLGDCWFVSSLSIVSRDDSYIKGKNIKQCKINPENLTFGVHPLLFHGFERFGLYVFKFYKKYEPVYVVVDDLFPIEESSGDLIFAKSPDPGLQWVAFLQKAYSKLHHAYSNMISGDIAQGLCDMVNCIPVKEDINNDNYEEMLEKLKKLDEQKQLMGCSITAPKGARVQQPVELDGERCGLFYSHAYSIGDVISLKADKEQFELMRVRNPWGHGEWCLDWSDNPTDPDYMKLKKYKKYLDKFYESKIKLAKEMREQQPERYEPGDDGQFIMPVESFTSIFSNLFTGFEFKAKDYTCQFIKQIWNQKVPSGICKAKGASEADRAKFVKDNHQYIMQINSETDVLMTLTQQDGRLYRGEKYPYKQVCNGIKIFVFTLAGKERDLDMFSVDKMTKKELKFELRRQVDFWHKFQKGRYAIIPCKIKNKILESEFELRVYSEESVSLKKVNGKGDFQILQKKTRTQQPSALSSMMDCLQKM